MDFTPHILQSPIPFKPTHVMERNREPHFQPYISNRITNQPNPTFNHINGEEKSEHSTKEIQNA